MKVQNPHFFSVAFAFTLLSNAILVMVFLCQMFSGYFVHDISCSQTTNLHQFQSLKTSTLLKQLTEENYKEDSDNDKTHDRFDFRINDDGFFSQFKDFVSKSDEVLIRRILSSLHQESQIASASEQYDKTVTTEQNNVDRFASSTDKYLTQKNVIILSGLLEYLSKNTAIVDFLRDNGYLSRQLNQGKFDNGKTLKPGKDFIYLFNSTRRSNQLATPRLNPFDKIIKNKEIDLSISALKRHRRQIKTERTEDHSFNPILKLKDVFSSFTKAELKRFKPKSALAEILIPALIHFEGIVHEHLENLHNVMVSLDLRLEELEKTMLNMAKEKENSKKSAREPQADVADNKSDFSHVQTMISEEGFVFPMNVSIDTLEYDGSGDGERVPPTEPTVATTTTTRVQAPPIEYYDLLRDLNAVSQKVMNLENYNQMSDSELTRIRTEVVKMDDKVTELDRQQRNYQVRATMQNYKLSQLESYMSRSEMVLNTAVDAYSRVNSRIESFKDRLAQFKSEVHSVSTQFLKHDQIANELRAADSFKAHDINELRKSMQNVEQRLNEFYILLDQNLEAAKNDIRSMLDRLCFNNRLMC